MVQEAPSPVKKPRLRKPKRPKVQRLRDLPPQWGCPLCGHDVIRVLARNSMQCQKCNHLDRPWAFGAKEHVDRLIESLRGHGPVHIGGGSYLVKHRTGQRTERPIKPTLKLDRPR